MKTKAAVLNGKPTAENPYGRFDEGKVVSSKSSHGPLFYKTMMCVFTALGMSWAAFGAREARSGGPSWLYLFLVMLSAGIGTAIGSRLKRRRREACQAGKLLSELARRIEDEESHEGRCCFCGCSESSELVTLTFDDQRRIRFGKKRGEQVHLPCCETCQDRIVASYWHCFNVRLTVGLCVGIVVAALLSLLAYLKDEYCQGLLNPAFIPAVLSGGVIGYVAYRITGRFVNSDYRQVLTGSPVVRRAIEIGFKW